MNRLALTKAAADQLGHHLAASAPLEEGAFCLLRIGKGIHGTRYLSGEVIIPQPEAWEVQTEFQLKPSTRSLSMVVSRAIEAEAGLLFIHSHPRAAFPPGLSPVDIDGFATLATTIAPMLHGPLAAVVVHPSGWSGVAWRDGELLALDRIVAVGRTLQFLSPVPYAPDTDLDNRQRDALGAVHDKVRVLSIGVSGCGGLGSPLVEQFVRMGASEVGPVDQGHLDTASNVRRMFGSRISHLETKPPKAEVIAEHVSGLGFDTEIRPIVGDVRTELVFRAMLDMDVIINATDTHSSRAVMNELASAYLLPVIDVGVRVGGRSHHVLTSLLAEVRVLTPSTPCLWCRGTISADVIRAENLPKHECEALQRERYVVSGIGDPEPSVIPLTVLGAGLAGCAFLALLSEDGEFVHSSYWVDGFVGDAGQRGPVSPVSGCRCRKQLALGDSAPLAFRTPR